MVKVILSLLAWVIGMIILAFVMIGFAYIAVFIYSLIISFFGNDDDEKKLNDLSQMIEKSSTKAKKITKRLWTKLTNILFKW